MKDLPEFGIVSGDFFVYEHIQLVSDLIAHQFNIKMNVTSTWRGICEVTLHDPDYPGDKRLKEDEYESRIERGRRKASARVARRLSRESQ